MQLKAYFAQTEGIGVLVTADGHGQVDAAIYARPQLMEDGAIYLYGIVCPTIISKKGHWLDKNPIFIVITRIFDLLRK